MSHKEPVVFDYLDCLEYVDKYGHANTKAALRKMQSNMDPNTSIEFCWCNAETPEKRAGCIRGAFYRISKKSGKEGRCSKNFTATFRVVSG